MFHDLLRAGPFRALCLAGLAGAALTGAMGCGSSSKKSTGGGKSGQPAGSSQQAGGAYDKSKLEAKLKTLLSGSGAPSPPPGGVPSTPSTPINSVTCPATQPAASASIQCTVSGSQGLSGSVTVTFDNAVGSAFHYKGKLQSSSVTQTVSGNSTLG